MTRSVLSAGEIGELEDRMGDFPIVGLARDLSAGTVVEPHHHRRGQLMYASSGVMVIETREGSWVIPPQRAIWVPEQIEHSFMPVTGLSLRNLLIAANAGPRLPASCTLITVGNLLRELVLRMAEHPASFRSEAHRARVAELILDELDDCPVAPLQLPEPRDPRLARICSALRDNPADARTLEDWADSAGASARTLSRLFLSETGLSFAHWRRQARLLAALVRLGQGQSVTTVAFDVGYDSPSAFIEMFRLTLGQTPGQYFC